VRYFVFACRALFLRNCIGAVDNHRGPGGSRFLSDNLRPVRMMLSLTIFLVTLPSLAQNQILNPPVWRFHAGDNPAWSEPGFDDSDWTQASFRELISRPYTGGTSWYRATFPVPAEWARRSLRSLRQRNTRWALRLLGADPAWGVPPAHCLSAADWIAQPAHRAHCDSPVERCGGPSVDTVQCIGVGPP